MDYTCHQCRALHPLLSRAVAHYSERLAVIVAPVAVEDHASEYARLALAVWYAAPEHFCAYHDWLMEGPTPPSLAAARHRADIVLGNHSLSNALADKRVDQAIAGGVSLYTHTSPWQLPKLLMPHSVLWGNVESAQNLIQILEKELGLTADEAVSATGSSRARKIVVTRANPHRREKLAASIAAIVFPSQAARAQLSGALGTHDPSSIIKDGSTYFDYNTGQGIAAKWSSDGIYWNNESTGVFSSPPAWTTEHVSGFTGNFWAPDVAYFGGLYHLYYAASNWGTIDSGIGVATSSTLSRSSSSYGFVDQGKVVASQAVGHTDSYTDTTAFNAIDPSILVDNDTAKIWMSWGSYSSGIVVTQLNPSTGKPLNGYNATLVANNAPGGGWGSSIEGSAIIKQGSYYYLFVNYGGCCSGVSSTYNIRVGRSTSPTGPFLDKNGVDMRHGGGTMFLSDNGRFIGPGHFARFVDTDGTDYFSYHYYDGDAVGAPTLNKQQLYWTSDAWPSAEAVNPDWSGSVNSNWSQSSNWWNSIVPNASGAVANFRARSSSTASVTLDAAVTLSTINFHNGGPNFTIQNAGYALSMQPDAYGNTPTINALGGIQTINTPVNATSRLAVNVFANGAQTWLSLNGSVTAPGLTKYGFGTLELNGSATFTGTVFVKWGTLEINGQVTANQFTSVGLIGAENGTLWVHNSGQFTTNADLNIGDTGNASDAATGLLLLQDNANVTVNSAGGFFVGSGFYSNTLAAGTVNQTGGTLTANGNFDGAFIIGGRTSKRAVGTYNLSGGAVNANTNVRVGGYGTGTVNQSGGSFNASGYISIGRFSGANGLWNISGGTLNQISNSASLIVGEAGSGTLIVGVPGRLFSRVRCESDWRAAQEPSI